MTIYPARLRFFAASALCAFLLLGQTPVSVQAGPADPSKDAATLSRLGTKKPTRQSTLKKQAASKPKAATKRHAKKAAGKGQR
jgi:hypothetical protein